MDERKGHMEIDSKTSNNHIRELTKSIDLFLSYRKSSQEDNYRKIIRGEFYADQIRFVYAENNRRQKCKRTVRTQFYLHRHRLVYAENLE